MDDYKIVEFSSDGDWRAWLDQNHDDVNGILLRIYKKNSNISTVTYAEALDHALCYGWIDGIRRSYDEVSFTQKFTPRRARSLWSKHNIGHITRLTTAGLMTPAGQAEIDRAKADGRWDAAYDKPSEMVIPQYFMEELRKNPEASAFFDTLNKTNRYTIGWNLQTAKTGATRARRTKKFIAMLNAKEKPHS